MTFECKGPVYRALGEAIEAIRESQGVSRRELAKRLPHNRSTGWVAHVESGRTCVRVHDLLAIADALCCSAVVLLAAATIEEVDLRQDTLD